MTKRPALLLAALTAFAPACGHKADPLPPLRRTPPALTSFRLAQRGDALELRAVAPAASVDGVAYATAGVEFLYGSGQADLEKAGRRLPVRVAPGANATTTLPLPAPGTLVRAAARGLEAGQRGPRTLTMALVAQPPIEPPRELAAGLGAAGIELAWQGVRPKEVPPPVGPKPFATPMRPASPAVPGSTPPGPPVRPGLGEPTALADPGPAPPAGTADTLPGVATTPPPPGARTAGDEAPGQAKPGEPKPGAVTVQVPPARRNGFFVYRRPSNGAYDQPLVQEPLDRRSFRDESAPLAATWCYVVRAVASTEPLIESAASTEVCVERRDVSPPEAPAGLAVLPRQGGLELLWSPSAEEDLAGYRVYRSAEGQPPQRLAELPPAKAAYLDESARQGVAYRYTLTAYDASGNESDPTDPVEATLP